MDLTDPHEEIPKDCPGGWRLSRICFDCVGRNPEVICPDKTFKDVEAMFPECHWASKEKSGM